MIQFGGWIIAVINLNGGVIGFGTHLLDSVFIRSELALKSLYLISLGMLTLVICSPCVEPSECFEFPHADSNVD